MSEFLTVKRLRGQALEARVIQGARWPSQPLHPPNVIVSHEFQPVTEVGGDYLDCFTLSDDNIGVYIGDVSGKGLPVALAVGTLRGVHKTGQCPSRVLSLRNSRLHLRGIPGPPTALHYAVFHPRSGEMRIVSAGMPGPLLPRGDKCRVLQIAGKPPGWFPEATYEEFSLQLQPGDSVFFCTHGLTHARDAMEEEFGEERIEEACVRHAESALDLVGHVLSEIGKFTANCCRRDDMTAAVFHYPSR
jgi:phosphoserine phosphatase RsbU/P